MKDRTNTQATPTISDPALPAEAVLVARVAAAEAAVARTGKLLADTYLPDGPEYDLTRQHEANRFQLAEARAAAGTQTVADMRLLAPKATADAEARFWASEDVFSVAGRQLTADLAVIAASGVRV